MKLCSRLFVLYCRSRPKDDRSRHFDPHLEEVGGGVEPWSMARWKARGEFLLSVIELLFCLVRLRRYKAKRVKTRSLQEWVGHLEPKFQGNGSSLGNIFFCFLQNQTHFAIQRCKLHRATCRRFDTIPACDGRTDGQTELLHVANTALAMGALRAL